MSCHVAAPEQALVGRRSGRQNRIHINAGLVQFFGLYKSLFRLIRIYRDDRSLCVADVETAFLESRACVVRKRYEPLRKFGMRFQMSQRRKRDSAACRRDGGGEDERT